MTLVLYIKLIIDVGKARRAFDVPAPAMESAAKPEFTRVVRVHGNQVEQLLAFYPAYWMFSIFVDPRIGFVIAAVWNALRFGYSLEYRKGFSPKLFRYTLPCYALIQIMMIGSAIQAGRALLM